MLTRSWTNRVGVAAISWTFIVHAWSFPGSMAMAVETNSTQDAGITLTESQAVTVALLEHVGPYWSLTAVLDRVRETMFSMDELGPVVVRYLDDPLTTPPRNLRSLVGFVLRGAQSPPESFKKEEWPSELVAELNVPGSNRYGIRFHHQLRSWVASEGLSPAGPIVESLFFPSEADPNQQPRLSIAMLVCEPDPEPSPFEEEDGVQEHALLDQDAGDVLVRASMELLGTTDGVSETATGGTTEPTNRNQRAASQQPPSLFTVQEDGDDNPGPSEIASVQDLIENGQFTLLAECLLPNEWVTDEPNREWTRVFVSRVDALARGIRKRHPDYNGWMTPFAEAVVQRSAQLLTAVGNRSREAFPTARSPFPTEAEFAERTAIIRRLELLMGRVSVQSLDPQQVEQELAVVLQEALHVVGDHK